MTRWSAWLLGLTLASVCLMGQAWTPQRIVGLEYPKSALVRNLEGSVEIECYIGNDGRPIRAEPRKGEPELAPAAIRNAMRWRFRRTSSGPGEYVLTYHFRIETGRKPTSSFRFVMPGEVFVTAEKIRQVEAGVAKTP
jgi:TonB family protein